jgi:hypothetical protein
MTVAGICVFFEHAPLPAAGSSGLAAAEALKVELFPIEASGPEEFESAFATWTKNASAVW